MSTTFCPTLLAITSSALLSGLFACSSEELEGAKAEVVETSIKLDLPPVPEFVAPPLNADGTHPVPELRLKGDSYLDTEIQVKGIVIWIYDCGSSIREPGMTDEELKVLLHDHPEKCTPHHFILGKNTEVATERGIQIVEYPRPLRKDELRKLPPEEILLRKAALDALPEFKVGDEVIVSGKWTTKTSPKGFQNSEGLIVFTSMENLTTPAPVIPEEDGKKKKKSRRRR